MLKDAKKSRFGVMNKQSSFKLTKYTESNYDGVRSAMSKRSQKSSQMLATEHSVGSDLKIGDVSRNLPK